ncbi:50S ribosome-binding protein YggL [Aeoliella mucimassa]|uniref:DUF469 domain-containing protein n=1 Tax=Aeoliella mucimassa TaxID=2527972 RepID=A0A518AVS7_9BACT|nr:50S ribosome-binding protein YggL [Aeoliella mucimassa]QDU58802.1 hypothetical protein Pan181_50420 [Aeoliella mucimassa]
MKKRLRKKLHRVEFAVRGVSVRASFTRHLDSTEFDRFTDGFIEEAIEARALWFGGGGHPAKGWEGVIEPRTGDTTIRQEDLEWVRAWLRERTEVDSFEISEPWDLWYGKNPFDEEPQPEA